jgi:hypothetical protein
MGNSNAKILRKNVAKEVESEILTINVDLQNLEIKIKNIEFNKLKRIEYTKLCDLRSKLQHLYRNISTINNIIETLGELDNYERYYTVGVDIANGSDHSVETEIMIPTRLIKQENDN